MSGAAFTFNPRDSGIFEIQLIFFNLKIKKTFFSVDNECYILEAPDNKFRIEWLSSLQYNRKQYYQQNSKDNSTEIKISENSQVCLFYFLNYSYF